MVRREARDGSGWGGDLLSTAGARGGGVESVGRSEPADAVRVRVRLRRPSRKGRGGRGVVVALMGQ